MVSSRVLLSFTVILVVVGAAAYSVGGQWGSPKPAAFTTTSTTTLTATTSVEGPNDLVQYCFSPGGNCDQILVSWINRANSSVHVLIYEFTLSDVSQALIAAQKRGVDVKVVMERENVNDTSSQFYYLKNSGISIKWDTNSALMHDKVTIIDGHVILTGSFNYTVSASNANNENLVVINSTSWGAAFEQNFQQVWSTAASP